MSSINGINANVANQAARNGVQDPDAILQDLTKPGVSLSPGEPLAMVIGGGLTTYNFGPSSDPSAETKPGVSVPPGEEGIVTMPYHGEYSAPGSTTPRHT